MLRELFRGWKAGVTFITIGLVFFIIDFIQLGSYDIYDPADWPGVAAYRPFLMPLILIPFGLTILYFELNNKNKKTNK